MRDMPPPHVAYIRRSSQSTVVTFIRERDSTTQNPQWKDTVTSSQNKARPESMDLFFFFLLH